MPPPLPAPRTLNLAHNGLTALPSAIRHLTSLTSLSFPSNRVATLPVQLFEVPQGSAFE